MSKFTILLTLNLFIHSIISENNVPLGSQCIFNGEFKGNCSEGTCFRQNTWLGQCYTSCPVGWACQDPNINSSNLTLWQQSGRQLFFQQIDQTTWQKIIFNSIVANLTVISNANDTVVLYDYVGLTYYALNSQYMYTGSSLSTLYSLNQYLGSWILVYYSAGIGNFSYFFNIMSKNIKYTHYFRQ